MEPLRRNLIRLAYRKPEFRKLLLPLVKTSAQDVVAYVGRDGVTLARRLRMWAGQTTDVFKKEIDEAIDDIRAILNGGLLKGLEANVGRTTLYHFNVHQSARGGPLVTNVVSVPINTPKRVAAAIAAAEGAGARLVKRVEQAK